MSMRRFFVGIPLPEALQETIILFASQLDQTGGDFRLVQKENLHLTLSFLGNIGDREISLVLGTLSTLCKRQKKFEVSIRGIGFFPGGERINVIWIGAHNPLLVDFIQQLNAALQIETDHAEEIPHLTIARVKSGKNRETIFEFLNKVKDTHFGSFRAEKIVLYASELTPNGPIYTVMKEFLLG
ncbi:RNA 2',3'-cyclic phosphodiesterase [Candidatus Woesearchaeota archaeon]|nr:RNA 2',3'-cyclic phosphodiesterase [Candidatus Woesearchaeota archaeon]